MKKLNLLVLGLLSLSVFAQNIDDNKVSFSYINLPTHPLGSNVKTYDIFFEKIYETSNEDSLSRYQLFSSTYENEYNSQMLVWKESVRQIDRNYLTQMASWEKASNAGTVNPQPIKDNYPPQPIKKEIDYPRLHSEIIDVNVKQQIKVEGYNLGTGGGEITLGVFPISDIQIKETIKGSGTTTKYEYVCSYKMPLKISVKAPMQGIILTENILETEQFVKMDTYNSKYDFQLWWLDNKDKFLTNLEMNARNKAFEQVSSFLNDKIGFPVTSRTTEIYTVKKHKGADYDDLIQAYTHANQGYQLLARSQKGTEAKDKLNQAVKIWLKTLEESNLSDNKARVNDKVTALVCVNLAEAYIWLAEFNEAELYINRALAVNVMKFNRVAKDLKVFLEDRKMRYNSNF